MNKTAFLHIPKTAGTSVSDIIESNYSAREIFSFRGNMERSYRKLRCLDESRLEEIKIFKGHFFYGIHNIIACELDYYTVMRDPVSQVLSYYNYVISNKRRIENRFSGNRYDIKEYIDSSDFVTNIQTKFLAGVNFENRADLPDADCYEKARTHLKKFKFIGAQEKFSDSIGRIAEELNWKHVKLKSRNASLKSIAELEGDVIEIVREKCKYDIALYEEFASDICTGDYLPEENRMDQCLSLYRYIRNRLHWSMKGEW